MNPGPLDDRTAIWQDLNAKFASNLTLALSRHKELCNRVETHARAIPVVAGILSASLEPSDWRHEAICMFDEIFADVICSVYLAACGLDKPAQMTLRRALEIGVATVFLWDLPHLFYGWKSHDKDLNFNDMVEHLGSAGFNSFVRKANSSYTEPAILDAPRARSLYRNLSNIVHGKMSSFESVLVNRFEFNDDDWKAHLEQVSSVCSVLIRLWQNRFHPVSERLMTEFPQLQSLGAAEL